MYEKGPEILIPRLNFHHQSPNMIVEMHHSRLVGYPVLIFMIGVLIGIPVADCALVVPGGHNLHMVVE
jgi:hypothetical protein